MIGKPGPGTFPTLPRWRCSGPTSASRGDYGIDALERAFQALGCEECGSEGLEPGFEKVALYGFGNPRKVPRRPAPPAPPYQGGEIPCLLMMG
jgi:hypothetical protein